MATIQKVSGIDFANISKFDGVDISAVGSINFIGKPATVTLLLDTYTGAAAAYSLRKLRTNYTGFAIKVQDNVGGATQDIGFNVFGELDTVSLLQYAGSNDVFVETWFDQGGSGNNATQPSSTLRPKIVSLGTVIVENGKPAVQFDGSDDFFSTNQSIRTATVFIAEKGSQSGRNTLFGSSSSGQEYLRTEGTTIRFQNGPNNLLLTGQTSGAHNLIYLDNVSSTTSLANNGGSSVTANIGTGAIPDFVIGQKSNGNFYNGNLQEIIIYNPSQSANRTEIETNINAFYAIY
tara:strand:+ start:1596 stop:2468 length:873 start_codon:yes stop_codon:yes gene_type:complete